MATSTNKITKRDNKVYEAELAALGYGGFFIDLADAQAWLNDILASAWWKNRSRLRRIDISYGVIKRWCWAYKHPEQPHSEAKIDLVRGRLCEAYILHELAHMLAWPKDDEAEEHGDRFIVALLEIVRHFMPKLYYKRLIKELEERDIKCLTK
jgi:hypothetical protein